MRMVSSCVIPVPKKRLACLNPGIEDKEYPESCRFEKVSLDHARECLGHAEEGVVAEVNVSYRRWQSFFF